MNDTCAFGRGQGVCLVRRDLIDGDALMPVQSNCPWSRDMDYTSKPVGNENSLFLLFCFSWGGGALSSPTFSVYVMEAYTYNAAMKVRISGTICIQSDNQAGYQGE